MSYDADRKTIIIKRLDDGSFSACVAGPRSDLCGLGKTKDEAVGDLVRSHHEMVGIEVVCW